MDNHRRLAGSFSPPSAANSKTKNPAKNDPPTVFHRVFHLNYLKDPPLTLLHKLQQNLHRAIALALPDLHNPRISAVTAHILRSDLIKQLCRQINRFCILLASRSLSRNLCHRVENLKHLSSGMKSGRLILFDLLLHLIIKSNLLAVNDFLYSLAVLILAGNLGR